MAHSWADKFERGARTTAQVAGAAHTAYQAGKALWSVGSAVAPYAAALLLYRGVLRNNNTPIDKEH